MANTWKETCGGIIYLVGKNKATCRTLGEEALYEPGEIVPWIDAVGMEGEPFGRQELADLHRGEIEVRGINAGTTRRRPYVDIGEVKREIDDNESDLVRLAIRLGWPKEREKRMALVDKVGMGRYRRRADGGFRAGRSPRRNRWGGGVCVWLGGIYN